MVKKPNPKADWHIQLLVECPNCKDMQDLMEMDDFHEYGIWPLNAVEGGDVYCPDCKEDFVVDIKGWQGGPNEPH